MHAEKSVVNGIILLDKPRGITSNDALQQAKRLFGAAKAGHGGTLDKPAEGALPVMFGYYTKLAEYMLGSHKTYKTRVSLGTRTSTGDAAGEILEESEVPKITTESLERKLDSFRGRIMQRPPIYSSLKYQGKRLYKYALHGEDVPIKPRQVEIRSLVLVKKGKDYFELIVECSRGTYIRSLAEDIGGSFGCCAHMQSLRRTKISVLPSEHIIDLAKIEETPAEERSKFFIPDEEINLSEEKIYLSRQDVIDLCHGKRITTDHNYGEEHLVSVYLQQANSKNNLLGMAIANGYSVRPKRIFNSGIIGVNGISDLALI